MEIQSLSNLKASTFTLENEKVELYDLTKDSFRYNNSELFITTIESGNDMRLDWISSVFLGTSDDIDVLCFLNDIVDALHVKNGDNIIYPSVNEIDGFRVSETDGDNIRKVISYNRNSKRVDNDRKNDIVNLPPTVNTSDYSPIDVSNGMITIGKGILDV